jgi:exodeoxyribonuclease VII small subunit
MPRRKPSPGESTDTPHFEESLASLEAIIEAMEHEQLPLEDLVAYYERGSSLLKHCESILQSARGRIELITLRNQSESDPENPANDGPPRSPNRPSAAADDFPDSENSNEISEESDDDDPDDIRLF